MAATLDASSASTMRRRRDKQHPHDLDHPRRNRLTGQRHFELAVMNLTLLGTEADFGHKHAATAILTCMPTTSSPTRPSTTPTLPCSTAHSFEAKQKCRS